jgi:hypothetical protein
VPVMHDWQRQVARFEQREKQWESEMEKAREQVQQAELEAKKALAQESRTRRDLAWLLERRQVETDEAAAHEMAAVEQVSRRVIIGRG